LRRHHLGRYTYDSTIARPIELGSRYRAHRSDRRQISNTSIAPNVLTYLQAGAFSSAELATKMREQIAQLISYPVFISREYAQNLDPMQQLFKVRIGPVKDNLELLSIKELFQLNNLPVPLVVYD
jgi:hypothetical protein